MAPKRPSPLEEPPAASSSSEEEGSEEEAEEEGEEVEEGEDEEEEEEESEEEKVPSSQPSVDKKPSVKKAPPKPEAAPSQVTEAQPESSSEDEDEEDGSDSDSDSDHSPGKTRGSSGSVNPNIKPITSKPMDDPSKAKKPPFKADVPSTPKKSATSTKRAVENDKDVEDSRKKKKKGGNEEGKTAEEDSGKKAGDDPKKQMFQRLWNEDDEIVILKGMIDFRSKKGVDPYAEMGAFYEFIKKSLHVDVSKTQLMDKVRRMKKKFLNNAGKGENGEDPVFSKPHDCKSFELSKKIWGSLANNNSAEDLVKANGKAGKRRKVSNSASPKKEARFLSVVLKDTEAKEEKEESLSQYPYFNEFLQSGKNMNKSLPGLGDIVVKEGLSLVGSSKAKELEKKWKKLQLAEVEVYLQRVELIREQTMLMLDALKSSLS